VKGRQTTMSSPSMGKKEKKKKRVARSPLPNSVPQGRRGGKKHGGSKLTGRQEKKKKKKKKDVSGPTGSACRGGRKKIEIFRDPAERENYVVGRMRCPTGCPEKKKKEESRGQARENIADGMGRPRRKRERGRAKRCLWPWTKKKRKTTRILSCLLGRKKKKGVNMSVCFHISKRE